VQWTERAVISQTLPQQNAETAKWNEAEVVERVMLVADHKLAEIAQPSAEPLEDRAALVPTPRPSILGRGALPIPPTRSDHCTTAIRERPIQRIGVVGAIPDEPLG
jgi:hypothetical protein